MYIRSAELKRKFIFVESPENLNVNRLKESWSTTKRPEWYKAAMEGDQARLSSFVGDSTLGPGDSSLLLTVVKFGNEDLVRKIIFLNPESLLKQDAKGDTPLHVAVRLGHCGIVDILIDCAGGIPLPQAEIEREIDGSRRLLRTMNHMNHTALHEAVRSGQFELVRSLIGKDAELATIVKEDDESAESPLCMAIRRRFFQIAEFFISSNKFSWRGPNGTTALHYAVLQKQSGIIQMLLERRPAMAREVDAEKCTPLHIAACIGYHKEARLLMEFDGSCADVRNKDHMLALHIAAHQGHINVIKVLTEYRPDLCNSCDDRGWNALHFAAKYGMVEVAQYIVNSPVFMGLADKTNNQRKLPFHLAQGNMVMRSILPLPEQSVRFWCFSSKGRKRKKYVNLKGIGRYVALMEHEPKEETEPNENNINSDPWKERSSIHLLVSTIITTVAFAAGITIPGGYINDGTDQGMPTLSRKAAFQIFMVANSLAFSLSISSMRIHFKGSMQKHYGNKVVQLLNAIPYIRFSMLALVVAFVSGTYAILANSSGFAIAVCIICSFICIFGSSVYRVPKWEVKKLKA